jgi:phosphate starvation-inducible protein PhoH
MNEKIDPYLRPIYDALYEMLGFDKVEKLLNKNIIEVAPLAFMGKVGFSCARRTNTKSAVFLFNI